MFSSLTAYACLFAGCANFLFGAMDRFAPGGPGWSVFGCGRSMKEMVALQASFNAAANTNGLSTNSAGEQEGERILMSSAATPEKVQVPPSTNDAAVVAANNPAHISVMPNTPQITTPLLQNSIMAAANPFAANYVPPSIAASSGYEMTPGTHQPNQPLLNTNLYNILMQQYASTALASQGLGSVGQQASNPLTGLTSSSGSNAAGTAGITPTTAAAQLLDDPPLKPPPPYLLHSPFSEKTRNKQWKTRLMAGGASYASPTLSPTV